MNNNKLAIFGGTPIRNKPISYGRQCIDNDDINAVVDVLKSDYLTQGPQNDKLVTTLCNSFNSKYAVLSNNGTSALHLACLAADIHEGDEVITTSLTFAASANCVRYCGGIVKFADINESSLNIDPVLVEKKITQKTKAIIAVDFAGRPVELKKLKQICNKHNLVLIEDAAHSIGSNYMGNPVGSIADMTVFSFHAVKSVTGGEGGALLTNTPKYYKQARLYATHGITKSALSFKSAEDGDWYYEQQVLGFNYRLTDIQAALIISQLNKLQEFKQKRNEIVKKYNHLLSNIRGIKTPQYNVDDDICWHIYVIRIDEKKFGCNRKQLYEALKAENIITQVHYVTLHLHPYYRQFGNKKGDCPIAEKVSSSILSLPLFPLMKDDDVNDVVNAIKKIQNFYKRG